MINVKISLLTLYIMNDWRLNCLFKRSEYNFKGGNVKIVLAPFWKWVYSRLALFPEGFCVKESKLDS